MTRATFLGAPAFFNLNQACRIVADAYGPNVFLVGSCLVRRDYRDVDVRCIIDDADFERLFPGIRDTHWLDARWSLMASSLSLYLSERTKLPIDFQFQQRTAANAKYLSSDGRVPLGLWSAPA